MTRTKEAANWSDADHDKLRNLWSEGWSATEIAWELGRGSRSAVLGKARRLGLPYRRSPTAGGTGRVRRERGAQKQKAKATPAKVFRILPPLPKPVAGDKRALNGGAWKALPGTKPVALVDIEPGMCRWPIGRDRPYLFCGCQAAGTYCEHHEAISVRRVAAGQLAEAA